MRMQFFLLLAGVLLVSGCVQNAPETNGTGKLPGDNSRQIAGQITDHTNNSANSAANPDKQQLYNSIKREIEALYEQNPEYGVGDDRYQKMSADLDSLEGFAQGPELKELRRKLDTLAPRKSGGTQTKSDCVSNENPVFTADITDPKTIKAVTPPRNEKTHSHVWIKDNQKVPVYAPVDAKLVAGSKYTESGVVNYLFFFDVSCEVEIKFDHVLEPVQSIKDMFPNPPKTDTRTDPLPATELKAGDLIGYTTGTPQANNWDFGVYNKARLNHLNGKEGYEEIDWRAGCPYDYFITDKKEFYYSLFTSITGSGAPPTDFCNG